MCGIAMVRLLKPLEHYHVKYGTWQYGYQKLYLMMEKQHNRGQEGAGMACVKTDMPAGEEYISRERALGSSAIDNMYSKINDIFSKYPQANVADPTWAKQHLPFAGEIYLGHLRYSTNGKDGLSYVQPYLRRNNWQSQNLILAGNFNLTNVDELFNKLTARGQHPRDYSDTFMMLEQLGHYLDREVQRLYDKYGTDDNNPTQQIEQELNIGNILRKAAPSWDGGYALCGIMGHGDAFVIRDPWGIRPAFYYCDDEIIAVASERPVIQTSLDLNIEQVKELMPGQALILKKDGRVSVEQIIQPRNIAPCSFERIYFSRGSDHDIYKERKKLGELLTEPILKKVDYDIDHTVFSFIPNTAEVAYYGMIEGVEKYMDAHPEKNYTRRHPRIEKVAIKDIKLRTFIAQDNNRNNLAAHVYDITYGSLVPFEDNLVIIDDSIVRGTTLKQSIVKILCRLNPKKIVIVSSSPQIRFPDCYGIDMSRMNEFIAFKAALELLKDNNMEYVVNEVYKKCKAQQSFPKEEMVNHVKDIYAPFTDEQISDKIAQMISPTTGNVKIEVVYQSVPGLHEACPNNGGDWYFTGDYPTAGGMRVVNEAFVNFIEGKNNRSYK